MALRNSVAKIVEAMGRLRSREQQYHAMQREREARQRAECGDDLDATLSAHKDAEALRRCEEEDAENNMQYLFHGGARQGWDIVDGAAVSVQRPIQPDIDLDPPDGYLCPHIPASVERAKRVARYAALRPHDVVYDLGCGDGRLLFELHRACGCRGVGVDINAPLIEQARAEALGTDSGEALQFKLMDMLRCAEDLSDASVVVVYLVPVALQELLPHFLRTWERRPELRVVTLVYPIEGLEPVDTDPEWKLHTYTGDSVMRQQPSGETTLSLSPPHDGGAPEEHMEVEGERLSCGLCENKGAALEDVGSGGLSKAQKRNMRRKRRQREAKELPAPDPPCAPPPPPPAAASRGRPPGAV